jgi:hypothetical protein
MHTARERRPTTGRSNLPSARAAVQGDALNMYWPIKPEQREAFLRDFIERNLCKLHIYEPALKGLDHRQAFAELAGRENFETLRKSLLVKEQRLRGNGSLQVAKVLQTDVAQQQSNSTTSNSASMHEYDADPFRASLTTSRRDRADRQRTLFLAADVDRVKQHGKSRGREYEYGSFSRYVSFLQQNKDAMLIR